MREKPKVYFIGAGPGDPELITKKGDRLIREADLIIYAGSLVNPEVLAGRKEGAEVYNSASLNLEQVLDLIIRAVSEGKRVARVHTGDPSMYGAIDEQIAALESLKIPYEVVPGVSSVFAAAARLKKEFTPPGVSQSLILTRMRGRTEVPEEERLENLARTNASLAIFLSAALVEEVEEELLKVYERDKPVAVVYKASWPEEKIIRTELGNLSREMKAAGIDRTALILVGDFLSNSGEQSKLYDKHFSHMFRDAIKD